MIQRLSLAHHRFCHFHTHNAHVGKLREVLRHPLRLLWRFVLLLIALPAFALAYGVDNTPCTVVTVEA